MSDNAYCYFNRHIVKIVENSPLLPSSDRVLVFYLAEDEWDTLSNGEFVAKVTKSLLFDVKYIFIEGETHKHLKFLINMLSSCVSVLPIVVNLDGCRTLFLEKTLQYLDGCSLHIKLPLKERYSKEDRIFFKDFGEYRTAEKYKHSVLTSIDMVKSLPLSIIRVSTEMGEENILSTLKFLSPYGLKTVVGGSI